MNIVLLFWAQKHQNMMHVLQSLEIYTKLFIVFHD